MIRAGSGLETALTLYNEAIERSRIEYRQHPFARANHGTACRREGCLLGWKAAARRAAYCRASRARRHTEAAAS